MEQHIQDAEIVSTTPEQETQMLIESETNKMIVSAITDLKKHTVTDEAIAHLKAEFGALSIADINDLQGYNAVKAGASKVKKIRTTVEAKRKELTEPALRFQREVKAEADRIAAELKPLEEELNKKKKDYEDAVEAAKRAEFQRRVTLLNDNGFQLINGFFVCGILQVHSEELGKVAQAQLDVYVKHGQDELARQEQERKRKEQEAELQRQEQQRLNEERAEIERMKAELEAERQRQAQKQAEIDAQTKAIETTYETVVQPIEFMMPTHTEQPIQNVEAVPQASVINEQAVIGHNSAVNATPGYTEYVGTKSEHAPSDEFERGFNAFRVQLTGLVNDTSIPLSRNSLREWAWKLPFPKH